MAGDNDGGDKTEQPTPKKLEDARKKGDVAKSKEVTSTVVLIVWIGLGALAVTYAGARFAALLDMLFAMVGQGWPLQIERRTIRVAGGAGRPVRLVPGGAARPGPAGRPGPRAAGHGLRRHAGLAGRAVLLHQARPRRRTRRAVHPARRGT